MAEARGSGALGVRLYRTRTMLNPRASPRQPRAGSFSSPGRSWQGGDFLPGPLAEYMSLLRWRLGCSLRYCDDWLGTDCLREVKPKTN